jgi:DNA-binding beta-propeller fold protein YncE/DNA-directed RNA polymerase subunit RPC12/RpoP
MTQTFDCPTCGAPLDIKTGADPVIRCPYCNASVVVPEELRIPGSKPSTKKAIFGSDPDSAIDQIPQFKEIIELARSGNKIEAIKKYRQITNAGLKDAKDMVEALAAGKPLTLADIDKSIPVVSAYQSDQVVLDKQVSEALAKTAAGTGAGISCFIIGLISFIVLVTVVPILIAFTQEGGPLFNTWSRINPSAFARMTLSFGGEGVGPGLFSDARYVAIDPTNGNILVGEYTGGRIQVFDSAGKFLTQWQVGNSKTILRDMAIDRKGVAYLIFDGDIHRYSASDGKEIDVIADAGGEYDYFESLALMADGGWVVTMDSDTIVRFNSDKGVMMTIPKAVNSVSEGPELDVKVAVDGVGNIYALGTFNEAIFKFGPNGKYITRIGGEGDEEGQFSAAYVLAVDNQGRIYVSDMKGIQVFDADGRYLDLIKTNRFAYGITITDDNTLYTINGDKMVYKYAIK